MKKNKSVKRKPGKLANFTFFTIIEPIIAVALIILPSVFLKDEKQALLCSILTYVGWALLAVGVILVIICVAIYKYYQRHPEKKQPEMERIVDRPSIQPISEQAPIATPQTAPEAMPDAVAQLDSNVTYVGGNVTYIPSMEAYEFINMGRYQTLEEKFEQISKMDRTQFVIYVARLFSRKGYQVKLTPVVDNYDIDLIVEKMDVTIAVGCLLTNKVLCKEDITCVREGKNHYRVNNCMALTNMYFDRTALEYARQEKMSLVDRNILAEDFMN